MRFADSRILIFAKAPVPGEVKTRLVSELGTSGACALYERLLWRVVREVSAHTLATVECWCFPTARHPVFVALHNALGICLREQRGEDLGARMAHAAEQTLRQATKVVLIGADSPVLTADHVARALEWLADDCDAVLGPAEDGGYVLLGLRRTHPSLFSGMPWGRSEVLALTRERLRQEGFRWRELETLWDIDRAGDLKRLEDLGDF